MLVRRTYPFLEYTSFQPTFSSVLRKLEFITFGHIDLTAARGVYKKSSVFPNKSISVVHIPDQSHNDIIHFLIWLFL
jgi:hypothetical protein